MPEDFAVNPGWPDGPAASASSSVSPQAIPEAIDGRMWFFPENPNGWSPDPADKSPSSWYSVDLKQARTIGSVELYFFGDGDHYQAPPAYQLQYKTANDWKNIPNQHRTPLEPLANGENRIEFPPISTQEFRIVFTNPPTPESFRLIEVKAFAP
jgi:hypothetical protein